VLAQIEALKRDESLPEILKVLTLQLGPKNILVAVTVRLDPDNSVREASRRLKDITDRIKALDRRISYVLFRFD
jgi:divalent metal cation (Fe/Co/Zn/Cd) transporter